MCSLSYEVAHHTRVRWGARGRQPAQMDPEGLRALQIKHAGSEREIADEHVAHKNEPTWPHDAHMAGNRRSRIKCFIFL